MPTQTQMAGMFAVKYPSCRLCLYHYRFAFYVCHWLKLSTGRSPAVKRVESWPFNYFYFHVFTTRFVIKSFASDSFVFLCKFVALFANHSET